MNLCTDIVKSHTTASFDGHFVITDTVMETAIPASIAAAIGAMLVWCGNHLIQKRLHRFRKIDDTKDKLYRFLDIVSRYWATGGMMTPVEKLTMETEMIAMQTILASEFVSLKNLDRSVAFRRIYRKRRWDNIELHVDELFNVASGGDFQLQLQNWRPDMQRARDIGRIVARLSNSLA